MCDIGTLGLVWSRLRCCWYFLLTRAVDVDVVSAELERVLVEVVRVDVLQEVHVVICVERRQLLLAEEGGTVDL